MYKLYYRIEKPFRIESIEICEINSNEMKTLVPIHNIIVTIILF